MRQWVFAIIVLLLFFVENLFSEKSSEGLRQSPALEITSDFTSRVLGDLIRVCQPSINPPLNDAKCKTFPAESEARKVRFFTEPVWIYLTIVNTTSSEQIMVLENNLAITTRMTILDLSDTNAKLKESGDGVSVKSRDYKAALPAFQIIFKAQETKTLRISLQSDIDTMMDLKLYTDKKYLEIKQVSEIIQAGFYGLMLGMILFNFILFLRLRLSIYLLYVGLISSLTLIYLSLYGHGFVFIWPDAFLFQKFSHDIFKIIVSFIIILFFSDLMSVSKRMPRLYRASQVASIVIISTALLIPFLTPRSVFTLSNLVVGIGILYMIWITVLSLLKKLPFNIFYILAMFSFVTGVIINLLMIAGVIPGNNFTFHAMQAGTAMETIFIAIVLGDRFAAIADENHVLQTQRIEDKKQIARDIHDVLGTELSMHLLEIETGQKNDSVIRLAAGLRKTVQKMREFLFLLHTDTNLSSELIPNVQEFLRRLEFNANILVKKDFQVSHSHISLTDAYHLERAIEESISNLARHAKANNIHFRLKIDQQYGFFALADDGVGFNFVKKNDNSLGIESLQYRADRLKGKLRIFSALNRGTIVALRFRI
ncbi:MAG: hypothetical protein OEV78_09180 [Spirochaetia bacterium]|nr:hypothetical protein [Spirochaetia bacterium]